eukprot:774212-Amphidinium_carterae.1
MAMSRLAAFTNGDEKVLLVLLFIFEFIVHKTDCLAFVALLAKSYVKLSFKIRLSSAFAAIVMAACYIWGHLEHRGLAVCGCRESDLDLTRTGYFREVWLLRLT